VTFHGFARPEHIDVAIRRVIAKMFCSASELAGASNAVLGVLPECADGLGLQGSGLLVSFSQSVYSMDGSVLLGRSILLVEAEPVAALEVGTGLRDAGAKVFGVHQLRDALLMAEYPALSAAVIAQRLGKDRTTAVCRRLADLGIPFMLHTRYDATEAKQKWPDAPVFAKPASARELIGAVAGLLS
jgi:hypothetical protein